MSCVELLLSLVKTKLGNSLGMTLTCLPSNHLRIRYQGGRVVALPSLVVVENLEIVIPGFAGCAEENYGLMRSDPLLVGSRAHHPD